MHALAEEKKTMIISTLVENDHIVCICTSICWKLIVSESIETLETFADWTTVNWAQLSNEHRENEKAGDRAEWKFESGESGDSGASGDIFLLM